MNRYRREWLLAGLWLVLLLGVSLVQPSFLSVKTLDLLWHDSALLIVLALAQLPIIMSRGIDLSVAANLALTGMLVAQLGRAQPDLSMGVLLLVGLMIGLMLGAINALLITVLELPPIVATLGTMSIFRGAIYPVSGGQWITATELSPTMLNFTNLRWLGLTSLEWISLLALLLAWLWLHQSRSGREVRALGGNPTASLYVGIPVQTRLAQLYIQSGALAGLVGVLWVSRYSLASTELAVGFELQVVAACVLGGVSIAGGVGTVYGAALGGLFLVTLYNALPVVGVSPFWQMGLVGLAILSAVVVNQGAARQRGKTILRREKGA
jgi:rhamnose transport system permease protein